MAIAVEIGVDDAWIGLWKMLEDKRPRIGVALLKCQQVIARKTAQDTIDTTLPVLCSRYPNTTEKSCKHNY